MVGPTKYARVHLTLLLLQLVFTATHLKAEVCQFYLSGDNKLFEKVPESLEIGSEIAKVRVHPRKFFAIEATDNPEDIEYVKFTDVDDTTIAILVAKSLEDLVDQAQPKSVLKFKLACRGTNSTEAVYLPVNIYIQDVNDHSPQFQNAPYFVEVDELTPVGLTIFRGIQAKDGDKPNTANSEVSYAIIGGNVGDTFLLSDPMEGNVVVAKPLDFDNGIREFKLEIQVQDHGAPVSHSSVTSLTIKVRDSDDQNPAFSSDTYRVKVNEKWKITGQPIKEKLNVDPAIHAEDLDKAIDAPLRYSILSGNEAEFFAIDSKDASLYVLKEIDREQLVDNVFSLQIQAVQDDNPIRQAKARVEIEILDLNDNLPVFEADLYNISIMENLPTGFSVAQVRALDEDQGDNAVFRFQLEDDSGAFHIDDNSGWITVKNQSKLDRELHSLLALKVVAVEKEPSVLGVIDPSSTTVEVNLIDTNDNNPQFVPSGVYHFNMSETAPAGHIVGTLRAVDADQGENGRVFYYKQNDSSSPSTPFDVHKDNGSIFVVTTPANTADQSQTYTLFIVAADKPNDPMERRTSLAVVYIKTEDVNNNPPAFLGMPLEANVGENLPSGTAVITLMAKDPDTGTVIEYGLDSLNGTMPFTIHAKTGVVTTTEALDFEFESSYTVTVAATDGNFIVSAPLTIHVVDVNDHVPQFTQSLYKFNVVEEEEPGLIIGSVMAEDSELGKNGEIQYKMMTREHENPAFGVTENGTLFTLRALDREKEPKLDAVVVAFDQGVPSLSGSAIIEIVLEDINDNPPFFPSSQLVTSVQEELAIPVKIAKVTAKDVDTEENAHILYYFTSGNEAGLFSLNQTSGEIWTRAPLDFETHRQHVLNVTAVDREELEGSLPTPTNPASTMQVVVNVEDRHDSAPSFERDSYVFVMSESQRPLEAVALVNAYNTSSPYEQRIVYWLSGGDAGGKLRLDTSSGDIVLLDKIDRDPPSNEAVFRLQVSARDLLSISPSNSSTNVTIFVSDVNDNSPKFEQDFYQIQVPEDLAVGSVLPLVFNATDIDEGDNGQVAVFRFNVTHPKFVMNNATSIVTLVEPLDYETENRYTFEILAVDKGEPERTGTATLIVNVLNINEAPPRFQNETYEFWAGENLGSGTLIGQVTARDGDGNSVLYSLVRGDLDFFDLDEATGKLYTKSDTGGRSLYHLVAMGIDDGQPRALSSTANITVHVQPANNHPPVFSQPVYETSVAEKDSSGHPIVQVTATDDDPLNNNVTYSIAEGNDDGLFVIDPARGDIRIHPERYQDLDYDIRSSYTLVVEAADSHGRPRVGVAMVKVTVDDTNDHPPKFTKPSYEAALKENIEETLCFLQVKADSGDSVDQVRYSIVGNAHAFAVDGASGQLCAVKPLDREVQPHYTLTVKATDNRFNSFATVSVEVVDENDNAPEFEREEYVVTVAGDAQAGSEVVTVRAEDPDSGPNGQLTYWTTNNYGLFELDPSSGEVKLLRGANTNTTGDRIYVLDLFAQDHGSNAKAGKARLVVRVSSSGGHKPRFDRFVYYATLSEQENTTGGVFLRVHATDPDPGEDSRVRYRLARSVGSPFVVDELTGELSVREPLDYNENRFHQVAVQAFDDGEELSSTNTLVQVRVLNTNNHRPVFYPPPSLLRLPVSTPVGQPVYRLHATDKDDLLGVEPVTYHFREEQSLFSLDSLTGDLIVERRLLPILRNLTIVARDNGNPPLENELVLGVEVYDEKGPRTQAQPVFSASQYVREVDDVIGPGTPVVQVQATTAAGDPLVFNATGPGTEQFGVDAETGIVYTRRPLLRGLYHLRVTAANRQAPLSSDVIVSVRSRAPESGCVSFTFPEYRASVPEDALVGRVIATDLQVEQPERYGKLLYKIDDDLSGGSFGLHTNADNTAKLVLEHPVDRESMTAEMQGVYELLISVTNNNCTEKSLVKVFVEDMNDNAPEFQQIDYSATVKENSPTGTFIVTLTANDVDEVDLGKLKYAIVEGNEDSHFSMDSRSGQVTVLQPPDREENQAFLLIVAAMDSGNNTGMARLQIKVLDENDVTPQFSNETFLLLTKEGPESLQANIVLEAVDGDSGSNSQLDYFIVKGNDEGEFNIASQANKGVFSVTQELDRDAYETDAAAVRFVVVGVRDRGNPPRTSSTTVTVVIEDINDLPPEFEHESYHELVSEGVPIGHNVTKVRAIDRDSAENTRLAYGLQSVLAGEEVPFAIDGATGMVSVTKLLDFADKNEYNMTLLVSDGAHTTLGNLKIYITETMERQPRMDQSEFDFRVEENRSGERVGQVVLGQASRDRRRPVAYRILSQEALEYFTISPDGTIYTKVPLDREKKETFTFAVVQEDTKLHGRKDVCEVHVVVEDVNDEAPIFSQEYVGFIHENASPGTPVKITPAISATDGDADLNAIFHFRLEGEGAELFEIDPSLGAVRLAPSINATLDRERIASYRLQVLATDLFNLSSSTGLTITVEDLNDNAPAFLHGDQTVDVLETASAGTRVAKVEARDADDPSSPNAIISYGIASGDDNKFSIDAKTGDVILMGSVLPETLFALNVSATDGGGRAAHALVHVRVLDVNNHAPEFGRPDYRFEVPEGRYARHPHVLALIQATDKDFGRNAQLEYKMASTTDDGWPFVIDATTGQLNISRDLDRETTSGYRFVVMAVDQGIPQLSSSASVTIIVTDVNDESPHFIGHPYYASVAENLSPGQFVAQVRAYDLDSNMTGNGRLFYKLGDEHKKEFFIDSKEGTIWTLSSLDFEKQNSYNVSVVAYDQGEPSNAAIAILYVNVTDKNDVVPSFPKSSFLVEVGENAPPGTVVYRLDAGSPSFKYAVVEDEWESTFALDGRSGEVTLLRHLDSERQSRYRAKVRASDSSVPANNDTAEVVFLVATGPALRAFPKRQYYVEVMENNPTPLTLIDLNATEEAASGLHYTIVSNDFGGLFIMDRNNGRLSVTKSLDREMRDEYKLKVRAWKNDNPQPSRDDRPLDASSLSADEALVTIKVLDDNDNVPDFGNRGRPLVAAAPVHASFGYAIMEVKAVDADEGLNAALRYELVAKLDEEASRFQVDPQTGTLRALTPLVLDAGKAFAFDVRATDRNGESHGHTALASVLVYVVPDNKLAVLMIGEKPLIVEENQKEITQQLSNATGYDVKLTKLEPHNQDGGIDSSATDLYLYAIDPTTNTLVDTERFIQTLHTKEELLARDLAPYRVGHVQAITFQTKSAQLSITEVALLAFGCIVFLAAALGIFLACLRSRTGKRKPAPPPPTKQPLPAIWSEQQRSYGAKASLVDRPSRSSYAGGSVDSDPKGHYTTHSNPDYNTTDVGSPRDSYKDSLSSHSTLDLQRARRNRQRVPSGASDAPPPPSPRAPSSRAQSSRRYAPGDHEGDDGSPQTKMAADWPDDVEMERTIASDFPPPPSQTTYYGPDGERREWWDKNSRGYGYQ